MTFPAVPTDPLEPWPDTVEWRPVSPRLITLRLITLSISPYVGDLQSGIDTLRLVAEAYEESGVGA